MDRSQELVARLADGNWHSGEALARALGVSRTAIWKQVHQLGQNGLQVEASHGQGYRLHRPFQPLSEQAINAELRGNDCAFTDRVDVVSHIDSTNSELLRSMRQRSAPLALLAESQQAGRGRRGRPWRTVYGGSLCLSVRWAFAQPVGGLSGLSLAAGISVVEALERQFSIGAMLKWPNDILLNTGKVGGILVELVGDPLGPCDVVIGLGLNLALPPGVAAAIDQPVTDIQTECGFTPDRNALAAGVLAALAEDLAGFEQHGFGAFHRRWMTRDALFDCPVSIDLGNIVRTGTARGVDGQGRLLVEHADGQAAWASGEVSVRAGAGS